MIRTDRSAASSLTPFLVLILGILIVVSGAVLNEFLFQTDDLPEDNGKYIDEQQIDYGQPYAIISVRNYGDITIFLDDDKAPIAVANFIKLAEQGFYNGLTFHRVIDGFMIQGGDPSGDGSGGPGYTIEGETDNGLTHDRGVISMAKRSGDTRMSGSQFFIVQGDDGAHHLDGEHTVFGHVSEGMDIVDRIANVQKDSNDKPLNSVVMESVIISYQ